MEQEIIEAETPQVSMVEADHNVPLTPPVNDYDIDAFIEKRKEFIEKVNAIMVEGKDYHVIQGRKSMAKGGSEKIANIFGWTATFEKDQDAMEAFSALKDAGVICFVCNLWKAGVRVGQGRGAAALAKNGGDPNKTLKMAQKSAFVDAVIRASGLSDFYTQDLEHMEPQQVQGYPTPTQAPNASQKPAGATTGQAKTASPKQLDFIRSLMDQKGFKAEDLIDQGFPAPEKMTMSEAKECLDFLLKTQSRVNPNGDQIEGIPFEDDAREDYQMGKVV